MSVALLLAVLAGGLIGLSLGALGGGGSILAVPVLLALGQTATQATTGSLVVVGVTSLAGAVTARRAGNVLLGRGVAFGAVAVGGAVSLLAGMLLIGSNGWPFSQQSRHITIRTGQLPLFISTVQRRYFASYTGADGMQSLCAGFGDVTITNRSRGRGLSLDLALAITPRQPGPNAPQAATPTREDLAAIARRVELHSI